MQHQILQQNARERRVKSTWKETPEIDKLKSAPILKKFLYHFYYSHLI
jgi:hypothetical protein